MLYQNLILAKQTELQGRLDDLNTTVPAVNDTDSDGVIDSNAAEAEVGGRRAEKQSKILSMRIAKAKAA